MCGRVRELQHPHPRGRHFADVSAELVDARWERIAAAGRFAFDHRVSALYGLSFEEIAHIQPGGQGRPEAPPAGRAQRSRRLDLSDVNPQFPVASAPFDGSARCFTDAPSPPMGGDGTDDQREDERRRWRCESCAAPPEGAIRHGYVHLAVPPDRRLTVDGRT